MKRAIALLFGTALVVGMLSAPAAANIDVPTTLKLKVSDKTPEYKTKVTFTSTLDASKKKCYANRPVKLLRNGEVLRSKKTNDEGVVKWKITIRANGKWRTKFLGRQFGTHPNITTCLASRSERIQIKVQNKP